MIDVIPGILEKDWTEIEKKFQLVSPHVDSIQIDMADGVFVPTVSFLDIPRFKTMTPNALFEAHLMVLDPTRLVKPLKLAGFKRVIGHIEAKGIKDFIEAAKEEKLEVGLAIDGPSPVAVIEPYLDKIEVALVMMAIAGASNLPMHEEHLEKIRLIRKLRPNLPIEVDEGVNDQTAGAIVAAGATRLVSTSYIFKNPGQIAQKIEFLKNVRPPS